MQRQDVPLHPQPAGRYIGRKRPALPWHSRLMTVCKRLGRSPEEAEDLVQDAYVRFLEYRRNHEVRNEAGLLSKIVMNLAINQYHRQRTLLLDAEEITALEHVPACIDPTPSAERVLLARERLDQVTKTLNRVSCRTCQIFLAHRGGYSYQEIAQEFGISHRTVQKHIERATILLGLREPVARF